MTKEWKTKNIKNIFHVIVNVNLIVENVIQIKSAITINVIMNGKKRLNHTYTRKHYVWNPSTCACECDKIVRLMNSWKNWTCTKSLIDDSVITCHEFVKTVTMTVSVDFTNKKATCEMDYYILHAFLLVTIIVNIFCFYEITRLE